MSRLINAGPLVKRLAAIQHVRDLVGMDALDARVVPDATTEVHAFATSTDDPGCAVCDATTCECADWASCTECGFQVHDGCCNGSQPYQH